VSDRVAVLYDVLTLFGVVDKNLVTGRSVLKNLYVLAVNIVSPSLNGRRHTTTESAGLILINEDKFIFLFELYIILFNDVLFRK